MELDCCSFPCLCACMFCPPPSNTGTEPRANITTIAPRQRTNLHRPAARCSAAPGRAGDRRRGRDARPRHHPRTPHHHRRGRSDGRARRRPRTAPRRRPGGVLDMASQIRGRTYDMTELHRFADPDYAALTLTMRDRENPGDAFDRLAAMDSSPCTRTRSRPATTSPSTRARVRRSPLRRTTQPPS